MTDPGFVDELREQGRGLGLVSPEDQLRVRHAVGPLRRRRATHVDDDVTFLALVEREDGSLTWREGLGARTPSAAAAPARRGGFVSALPGRIAALFKTERLAVNEVARHLDNLDRKLTPNAGLRLLTDRGFTPLGDDVPPAPEGRILLFVHGTFSNAEGFLDQLRATGAGAAFLAAAAGKYRQVLAFDHHTLSVSPVLNGLDLARRFAGTNATVDVVAHSRGGLVTRWWLEGFGGAAVARRAVLVGAPLDGTSLAAPHRLRSALDFVTNIGNALKSAAAVGSMYLPFLTVGAGLARVFTTLTSAAAKTPLADAALSMIPGLSCQSRVDNNFELQRIRRPGAAAGTPGVPDYYFVTADFRPDPVGWQFWRRFVRWRSEVAHFAADVIFDEEKNDLVVDSDSMTSLSSGPGPAADHVLNFGTTGAVHHCNYFVQPDTVGFLSRTLLPDPGPR